MKEVDTWTDPMMSTVIISRLKFVILSTNLSKRTYFLLDQVIFTCCLNLGCMLLMNSNCIHVNICSNPDFRSNWLCRSHIKWYCCDYCKVGVAVSACREGTLQLLHCVLAPIGVAAANPSYSNSQ